MKYIGWLLIIILCCSIPVLLIGCSSSEDYTCYSCESRILSTIPEPGDLGVYNTSVIDYIEIDVVTARIDVFAAIRDGLKQKLLAVGVVSSCIERAERINMLSQDCFTYEEHEDLLEKERAVRAEARAINNALINDELTPEIYEYLFALGDLRDYWALDGNIRIDIFCALKSGISPDTLEEVGIRGNSLAWAQAIGSLGAYSSMDSETGEIIVDITDALLKGIPPAVLVTVGFTQAEVDKAQAINQIYQYGTVDPETGDLILTNSQISKALDEGVPQSTFLAAGIPEEAVDRS